MARDLSGVFLKEGEVGYWKPGYDFALLTAKAAAKKYYQTNEGTYDRDFTEAAFDRYGYQQQSNYVTKPA